MPVPVPLYRKEPAHPVIKINQSAGGEYGTSVFQHVTHSLPLPPQGPPPSFATREEWISSLPSWRRNKPRRIWEEDVHRSDSARDFREGLTVAGNATVSKGALAQACIPPVSTLIASADSAVQFISVDMYATSSGDADEEMSGYAARMNDWRSDDEVELGASSPLSDGEYDEMCVDGESDPCMDYGDIFDEAKSNAYHHVGSSELYPQHIYERGVFTPVIEDMSPEPVQDCDPASSPIGPATPFAEFVDRAYLTEGQPAYDVTRPVGRGVQYGYQDEYCGAACYHCHAYQQEEHHVQVPQQDPVITPTATTTYKRLAEPLSEWIASYVWKVCTTGMDLPSAYAEPRAYATHFPCDIPSHLASSTHSMLLSTLLQPSAVFLALWYIARLPVFFGPVSLDSVRHTKEIRFRTELLGEAHLSYNRDTVESYAPFRLVLLGCMLANKWLDDHTFSNKTWHTISNVPVRSLNKLEELALSIFKYDLSIAPEEWMDWVSHLSSYHASLSSPACPQPISRPSTNPHIIVRKALDTILVAKVPTSPCSCCDHEVCPLGPPKPIFVGLEDLQRDSRHPERVYDEDIDVLEIDLDEDGPLREEYLPRRRTSGASSLRRTQAAENTLEKDRHLPPPARWSPAADEPIARDHSRTHGQYVAPQPIAQLVFPPPVPYQQPMESHHPVWSYGGYPPKQEVSRLDYLSPGYHMAPPYTGGGFDCAYPPTHSRSHSLSYNQVIGGQLQGRFRSYSQTQYDQGFSDARFSDTRNHPPVPGLWPNLEHAGYPAYYDRPFEFYPRPVKV